MLRVKERRQLTCVLESLGLDPISLCQELESRISKGVHFTIYPERKALWDFIRCSRELPNFISVAKARFMQLYMSCGKGSNKYAHFFRAWKEYMVTHTCDNPSPENIAIWEKLVASYPYAIPEDDKRIILCDVLHTLQSQLTAHIAKDLEKIDQGNEHEEPEAIPSDDTALYRIGGWAILSARKFRESYIKKSKESSEEMQEDIQLLKDLQIAHDSKKAMELPSGLAELDRGRLTFPKEELLLYLRETEVRILEFLNETNYKRYGHKLFQVTP